MDRRNAIKTLSGIVAAAALVAAPRGQAFAQTSADTANPIGPVDYKTQTLAAGTFSKQSSQFALTRAVNPKVRQFAQFEIAEQLTVAQVLTGVADPSPAPLDQMHTELLAQLQVMSGKAFDAAYVQGQIAGHRELRAIQQSFLSGQVADLDREHIAMLARTVIDMHLVMLQDLQSEISA